ncbi:MAG: Lrp/AsnC family transcriptional regulator, partial [Puniceicoccales bacterium]|nr:Lrp/AsnC family transcriptional regulator [Puniceicoccales bacterium]
APEFEITSSIFSVCFCIRNNNKAIAEESDENGKVLVPLGTRSGTTNGTRSGTTNLDEDDIRLLKALLDNPITTYDKLAVMLDMPRRTVSRKIDRLRKGGIIEREGATKNGRWIVHPFDSSPGSGA